MDDAKEKNPISLPVQTLLIVHSYHHRNTELVARAIGKVLCAQIVGPEQLQLEQIQQYDLLGFGSGIYDGKHHNSLLNLADRLPAGNKKKVFLFSTCGVPGFAFNNKALELNHSQLRGKLLSRGYTIIGEFGCPGLNTNSFLKSFGGLNKGRPNGRDLEMAEEFARKVKTDMS